MSSLFSPFFLFFCIYIYQFSFNLFLLLFCLKCLLASFTLPLHNPSPFLLLSFSHCLYAFAPFSIFSLLPIPLPLTSSLRQIQYVRSLISWGNMRKSTLTSLFIYIHIHTFSSSPTICPSTTSDQASKSNCPPAWTNRQGKLRFSLPLSHSAESIAPLHLSVHSIRDNNGPTMNQDCLLLWQRMSISKLDRTKTTMLRRYVWKRDIL